jgi:hypothetical protein
MNNETGEMRREKWRGVIADAENHERYERAGENSAASRRARAETMDARFPWVQPLIPHCLPATSK